MRCQRNKFDVDKKENLFTNVFYVHVCIMDHKTPIDDADQDDDRYLRKITGACWPTLTEVNEVSN